MSKKKVELLPSIEEIHAEVLREKQGIPAPGEEKRFLNKLWINKVLKESEENENFEDDGIVPDED